MMQRVTNMEMLKLSYWSPTKDMQSVIQEIKAFLQQWARSGVTVRLRHCSLITGVVLY